MRQLDSAGEINPQLLCDAPSPQFRNCTTLKSHMTTDRGQPGEEECSYVLMILSMSLIRFLNRSNRIRHRRSIAVGQVELHILLLRVIVRPWDEMRHR